MFTIIISKWCFVYQTQINTKMPEKRIKLLTHKETVINNFIVILFTSNKFETVSFEFPLVLLVNPATSDIVVIKT